MKTNHSAVPWTFIAAFLTFVLILSEPPARADICGNVVTVERYTVLGATTLKSEQGWLLDNGQYQVFTSIIQTWSESIVSQYLPISGRTVCQLLYYNAYKSVGCLKNWVRCDRVYGAAPFELVIVAIAGKEDPCGLLVTVSPSSGGDGTVSGGGVFKSNSAQTVKAIAKPGYVFVTWTENGEVVSTSASYTFILNDNRNLVANFIPNPFLPTKGIYNGLFYENGSLRNETAGLFTATTTDKGGFTAKLLLAGKSYSTRGTFDASGHATNAIARAGLSPLTVELELDFGGADQIRGRITDGSWFADLLAYRAVFLASPNPSPHVVKYTMVIPGESDSSQKPGGYGAAALTVDAGGRVKLVGILADNTKFTCSTTISKVGLLPVYVSLYRGGGLIIGWMTFTTNEPISDLQGELVWSKPPDALAKYYPAGFRIEAEAVGSKYVAPVSPASALNFSSGSVVLESGGLVSAITNEITLGPSSKVLNLSSNRLALTLTASTGLFKGNVTKPGVGGTLTFSGAVLQKINSGFGFFLGTNQIGQVYFGP